MSDAITWQEREALIKGANCFSHLSSFEVSTLASLMEEHSFQAGEPIVIEGELVDCIYIIAEGSAEVARQNALINSSDMKKKLSEPLAIFSVGDAIGLDDVGLFASLGKRTATLIALVQVKALKIYLTDLETYLLKP